MFASYSKLFEISCCFEVQADIDYCGCVHGYDEVQQTDGALLCVATQ